ncbi:ABC transporter ATP-binding protein [Paraglaciecola aquimarina]|uniref:ABC transporter ATP-binding protein n=1 Tax=Paraglaciecola algarum TaxID=3050085 RepID=A0ABS9D4I4_9ALTE|nr:ABC transporter ATP-binding protein [Paraglaciecola sp. G1-23]MCF2947825.1 ABC transporter ATP-binding protein [Paraglaciecola sp. G1-23]
MLSVENITRTYGSFTAVDQVSFNIKQGEIVGLLGHNGAGKTTIMKMLSGYIEPNQGEIFIDGKNLELEAKSIQSSLGYLPESLPVYPEMTVADYLDYAADIKGLTKNIKKAEIKKAIQATELTSKLLAPIDTLSRGFKQRVGVAQAILGQPKLLILDEPTNGLDPTQTEQMRKLIKSVAKHATVILSTHIMQEVDALCDRVLIINSGQLVVDSTLDKLRNSKTVRLVTSMDGEQALLHINPIAGIEDMQPVTAKNHTRDVYSYEIKIAENQKKQQVMAAIANTVISAQQQLFEITEIKRDLETVFRDISDPNLSKVKGESQHKEFSHAA